MIRRFLDIISTTWTNMELGQVNTDINASALVDMNLGYVTYGFSYIHYIQEVLYPGNQYLNVQEAGTGNIRISLLRITGS